MVAGPGSGKTRVLVERFHWLVEAREIRARRILAITFTEKAAANMRRRLVESFPPASAIRQDVERAYISTIHACCARLLRENAIEAEVDPEFRVLDEWEADFELRRAIDEALEDSYQADPAAARRFLAAFGTTAVAESLRGLYGALRAAGTTLAEAGRLGPEADWRERWRALLVAFERLGRLPVAGWRPSQIEVLEEFRESGGRLADLAGRNPSREHLATLAAVTVNLQKLKGGSEQRELARAIREELTPACRSGLLLEMNRANRAWFLAALAEADRRYRAGKRASGTLDFADLEEHAIRLLESGAGQRVRDSFWFVLMDEFQDTNPQQARLAALLRSPGNFFAVGDINQSIYGFRHADPTVFAKFRDETRASGGHVVELFENFRSRPEVLDAVRAVIDGAEGVEPQELRAGRPFPPEGAPSFEILTVQAAESDEALELEARHVGARIRQLAAAGRCGWGEVAVLLRTSANVRVFERELRRQGIPCEVTAGRGYYEAREVNDLLCFLRVLLDPQDEISLAAVLRSPLVGLSDETLLRLKLEGGRLADGLARTSDLSPEQAEKLKHSQERLARFRRDREYVPPDQLLGRLLSETGYEMWLAEQPGGGHGVANVRKLLALARRFAASGPGDLAGFVERVEDLRRQEVRESDAQPPEQTSDAVQLMTLHAAKGLEFRVVFLPAINRRARSESDPVRFHPQIGVGLRWRDLITGKDRADTIYEAVADEAKGSRREESQRLFYVGMTRAEELLILSASFGSQVQATEWAKNLHEKLQVDLRRLDEGPREAEEAGVRLRIWQTNQEPPETPAVISDGAPEAATEPAAAVEWLERPAPGDQSDTSVAATAVALFAQCPRRYYLSRYLGFEGPSRRPASEDEADPPEPDEMDATEFGRHVHSLLAGTIPREGASPEALRLVDGFAASEWGRRAAGAARSEREQSFLVALDGRLLTGQIDLWFREGGETVVLDYKTDQVTAAEAAARAAEYEWQLRLYALAVERLAGTPPQRAVLYFLRPEVAVEVSLAAGLLDEARRRVEELCQAQSRVEFPLREGEHCFRCPHFKGLCPAGTPAASGARTPSW